MTAVWSLPQHVSPAGGWPQQTVLGQRPRAFSGKEQAQTRRLSGQGEGSRSWWGGLRLRRCLLLHGGVQGPCDLATAPSGPRRRLIPGSVPRRCHTLDAHPAAQVLPCALKEAGLEGGLLCLLGPHRLLPLLYFLMVSLMQGAPRPRQGQACSFLCVGGWATRGPGQDPLSSASPDLGDRCSRCGRSSSKL